jgi:hypothetical protein
MIRLAHTKDISTGEELFVVKYMTWSDFRYAMIEDPQNLQLWQQLAQADCIIGGVDVSLSYL